MTPNALAALEQQIAKGAQARSIVQAAAAPCPVCSDGTTPTIFHQRAAQIARELVLWFRSGVESTTLDPAVIVRFAAALSEVHAIIEELEHRARAMGRAQAALTTSTGD